MARFVPEREVVVTLRVRTTVPAGTLERADWWPSWDFLRVLEVPGIDDPGRGALEGGRSRRNPGQERLRRRACTLGGGPSREAVERNLRRLEEA